jgi:hypothetical protein
MVYLIHFSEKLHHAQHYLGFVANDLIQRIELHASNRGDRRLERKLKGYKKYQWFCPVCRGCIGKQV